jgi:hypothetical protein
VLALLPLYQLLCAGVGPAASISAVMCRCWPCCLYISCYMQVLALLPVYLLQICYGMNSGFPAILTPQLRYFNFSQKCKIGIIQYLVRKEIFDVVRHGKRYILELCLLCFNIYPAVGCI